ncbi:MAG: glycosyltransferase family 4 protein [Bacteroidales bacterium]|nr:glycosyltransferase family 4 protein [Bacteroidales bacterium]
MNILFLTLAKIDNIEERMIYQFLMKEFVKNGHLVYIVCPLERRFKTKTHLYESDGAIILRVKTLNIQKTNVIEKGIGTLIIGQQFMSAINKYWSDVKFDLVTYSTPPITIIKVIDWVKKKYGAKTYLQLKDIFPQNALDLGMLTKTGIKGIIYQIFRNKEKKLYQLSDYIGCMSPANVEFVIKHNLEVNPKKVELCPNSFDLSNRIDYSMDREEIRRKYRLPLDKIIFIYGGNLGKPQGVPFLVKCLDANKNRKDCHFLVVGSGTDYNIVEDWYKNNKNTSVSLHKLLPKEDYDKLVQACDVGLIFLDYRFTIPNYPSRLLSYLENRMPVIACTDNNSDVGPIAENEGYGFYCPSNNVVAFTDCVNKMIQSDIKIMGEKGYHFMEEMYQPINTYNAIMNHFND